MPRKPRIEFPGALYHVMVRGNRKQDIFGGDRGKERFLEKLSEYKKRYNFLLYAYALMRNHLHLLIEMRTEPISKIMQGILQSHTQWFNRKHNAVGHLFQGRYKSILCDKNSYLLALVRYQHLNCVSAGLVKDPSQSRWSSHRIYLGLEESDLVDTEFVLSQFSKDRKSAVKAYHRFILDGMKTGKGSEFDELKDNTILGDERFLDYVAKKTGEEITFYEDKGADYSLKEILQEVVRMMGVSESDIISCERGAKLVKARSLFVHACRKYSKASNKQVSSFLNRSESTISNIARQFSSQELKEKIEMIKAKGAKTLNNK
jgi:putative transposase